jgi:pimeloyl-ACP methyl ester carboxylesterase
MNRTLMLLTALALGALGLAPAPASGSGALPVDPPVLGSEVPRGSWTLGAADPIAPAARSVDGDVVDWVGEAPGYAGTVVHSAGELIYTDHLFDAYGADDGTDTQRRERLGALEGAVPEAYRLEATINANLPGQVGVPPPPVIGTDAHYGNLGFDATTDLVELRLAADADRLWVLARTSQLHEADQTALLLLLDTDGQQRDELEVPFDTGITTERANLAVLLVGDGGHLADLDTGAVTPLPPGSVATNPEGFTNAIEAALPLQLLGAEPVAVTAATGAHDPDAGDDTGGFADTGLGANLANVAFRLDEPVREWFDERQALALHAGSIDEFLHELDFDDLRAGRTDTFVPGPGYHERVFASTTPGLAQESGREGLFQHYGLYLPTAIVEARESGEVLPLQLWLHWRGGNAHSAGAMTPGVFRHFGEDRDGIVVSPRGRGTSTWYVSRGHADVLEVLDDVEATQPTDPDRVYLSGHSMGGYGSYLFAVLYPDRFAATLPVAGPVTQGAWTGVDVDGCDEFAYDEYTPCYIQANDGRARDQHTRRMLDNLRNTPIGMFYAAADELVPISGAVRQHERLLELGYRHRFFNFPAHEHFTHPVVDEWAAGVAYLDQFVRDENPPEVTYLRDRAFEAAVNEVRAGGITFDWRFDSAYWMSELELADGAEVARFDGRSLAIAGPDPLVVPDTDAPTGVNQAGPYTVTGLQWIDDPLATDVEHSNGFEAELTGASRVRLDLPRMGLDTTESVTGEVTSEQPLELQLAGDWEATPVVEVDGEQVDAQLVDDDLLTVTLPDGDRTVTVTPQEPDDAGGHPGRSGEAPGRGGDGPPGGPPGPGTVEYHHGRGR